jgi:predicted DNA-binding transcriptional regulator AlpA
MDLSPDAPYRVLGVKEVCALFDMSPRDFRTMLERNDFPPADFTTGKRRKWKARTVMAWIDLRAWLEKRLSVEKPARK